MTKAAELKLQLEKAMAEILIRDQVIADLSRGERPDFRCTFGHWNAPAEIEPDEDYIYELWRPTGALGGILLGRYRRIGQSELVGVQTFDSWKTTEHSPGFERQARELLTAARELAYRKEAEARASEIKWAAKP